MPLTARAAPDRLAQIEGARRAVFGGSPASPDGIESWVERSWRRCLSAGHNPGQRLGFDLIAPQRRARVLDTAQPLVRSARPVLDRLTRALASTRYFAILTDADGVVVDVHGPIDRSDRRADLITRIGVDLSERSVGTTAIGAALSERHPVWLHRGEHFFDDTAMYSCAGAPLFGAQGECVGMLDLTGIDAAERPELKHLVAQAARSIGNALALATDHTIVVRLNWPGRTLGHDDDGIACLDADGWIRASNDAARQMVPQLASAQGAVHSSEVFAQPWEHFFDMARQHVSRASSEVPLWTGLRLQAFAQLAGEEPLAVAAKVPLRDAELALIRKAVDDANGNVVQAARALGISRATIYRKLGR